jgi:hypothetical protein
MRILLLLAAVLATLPAAERFGPGKHKDVQTEANAECRYDLVVPSAYASEPERRFPVLFTQVTAAGASTFGFDDWAEDEGVIICAIRNNGNHGQPGALNEIEMQGHAIASLEQNLRVHHCLRFSTGVSASAMRAMIMARDRADAHAGVLMQAHSGNGVERALAPHILVGFSHGRNDTTHKFSSAEAAANLLRQKGNPVRTYWHDGGHDGTDKANRDEGRRQQRAMLTWMLWSARLTHPSIKPEERKAFATDLAARAAVLAGRPDRAQAAAALDGLIGIEGLLANKAMAKPVVEAWGRARLDAAKAAGEPSQRVWQLAELSIEPLMAGHPAQKELQAAVKELTADKAMADEHAAWKAWRELAAQAAKAGQGKGRTAEIAKALAAVAKRYPGTIGAERAERDALALAPPAKP